VILSLVVETYARSNLNIQALQWTNLLEEPMHQAKDKVISTLDLDKTRVELDMRGFEIRTLQITLV
jgi:hypothetical protein